MFDDVLQQKPIDHQIDRFIHSKPRDSEKQTAMDKRAKRNDSNEQKQHTEKAK